MDNPMFGVRGRPRNNADFASSAARPRRPVPPALSPRPSSNSEASDESLPLEWKVLSTSDGKTCETTVVIQRYPDTLFIVFSFVIALRRHAPRVRDGRSFESTIFSSLVSAVQRKRTSYLAVTRRGYRSLRARRVHQKPRVMVLATDHWKVGVKLITYGKPSCYGTLLCN